jgi:hypothetical protein
MTTSKKIEILNAQIDKLQFNEAQFSIFHTSSWKTETLEYFRVFFGEESEVYKKCKKYNEDIDEENRTITYDVGSVLWLLYYTDLLFTAIGILQHELYKSSKFSKVKKGFTIAAVISLISVFITSAFYVGKMDGLHLRNVLIQDSTKNISQEKPAKSTTNQSEQNHNDTIKKVK